MTLSDTCLRKGLRQSWELWPLGPASPTAPGARAPIRLSCPRQPLAAARTGSAPGPGGVVEARRVRIPGNTLFWKGAEALSASRQPAH